MLPILVAIWYVYIKQRPFSTSPVLTTTHYTNLNDAVRAGDVSEAKRLIALGSNFYEQADGSTYPLLFVAAFRGDLPMVKCLVESGANVHEHAEGFTALHAAAKGNHAAVVKYLLQCDVKVDLQDQNFDTPLLLTESKEVIALLLDHGANINAGSQNTTVLIKAVEDDNLELVQFLLEKGADPSSGDANCRTPLHLAVDLDRPHAVEIVQLLLAHGADVNATAVSVGLYGTPLAIAAKKNNQKMALLLLSQGADINEGISRFDDEGRSILESTPLHQAASYGHADMMRFLIEQGKGKIQLDVKDRNGLTAFEIAATKHNLHFN